MAFLKKISLSTAVIFLAFQTQAQIVQFGFFRKSVLPQGATSCPTNYILVPKLTGYTSLDFCVAKYEAKQSGSVAVSQPSGLPWVSQTRDEATTACQSNGAGYNLITNNQWQTIARNIEAQAANWSSGVLYNSYLNYGNSVAGKGLLAANSSDTQACDGTGQTCSNTVWNQLRRTHVLSNGSWIWDLAGNAEEWVKDTTTFTSTSHYVAFLTVGTQDKNTYGPAADYVGLALPPYNGAPYGLLGVMTAVSNIGDSMVRGGHHSDGGNSGIFRLYSATGSGGQPSRGFRCTYNP